MEKPPILTMTGAAVSRAKELMNRGDGEVQDGGLFRPDV